MMELTVKMKSEDGARSYSKKFLVYDQVVLNSNEIDDLKPFVDETLEEWGDEKPEDVRVSIKIML
jgi:hypothetical protein